MARGEGIKKLSALFDVYVKRLSAPQRTVVDGFCEAVESVLGVSLDSTHISYTPASRTITLRLPGAIKSEILLQKKVILEAVEKKLGQKNTPRDII